MPQDKKYVSRAHMGSYYTSKCRKEIRSNHFQILREIDKNSDDEQLFQMYFEKSENILKDRNNFLALIITGLLIGVSLYILNNNSPVYNVNFTSSSNLSTYDIGGQITTNYILPSDIMQQLILFTVTLFAVAVFIFSEIKYREYKWAYQTILIRKIVKQINKNSIKSPTTYGELCNMVSKITLYSSEHIMPILRDLIPVKPDQINDKEKLQK